MKPSKQENRNVPGELDVELPAYPVYEKKGGEVSQVTGIDDKHIDDSYQADTSNNRLTVRTLQPTTTTTTTTTPASHSQSTTSSASVNTHNNQTVLYAFMYFGFMVLMEIVLEGTQNAFNELQALPFCITFFQFTFSFLFPVFISKGGSIQTFPKSFLEVLPFGVLSVVLFASTCSASLSVRYVSFPTKIIFKSTKLIPTMVFAVLLRNNRRPFTIQDFGAAILLCSGAAGYSFGESHPSIVEANQKTDSYIGVILLSITVTCDALFPNLQQRLMMTAAPQIQVSSSSSTTGEEEEQSRLMSPSLAHQQSMNSSSQRELSNGSGHNSHNSSTSRGDIRQQLRDYSTTDDDDAGGGSSFAMSKIGLLVLPPLGLSATKLMTNAYGIGGIGVYTYLTFSGHLADVLGVLPSRPHLLANLTFIGLSFAVATWAFTRLIQQSGSVTAVTVATLRKVVTVFLSYILYPKVFSILHMLSGVLVLGGILLSCYNEHELVPSTPQVFDTTSVTTTMTTTVAAFSSSSSSPNGETATTPKMMAVPTTTEPPSVLTPRSTPKSRIAESSPIRHRLGIGLGDDSSRHTNHQQGSG
jgi:UAA transporter family